MMTPRDLDNPDPDSELTDLPAAYREAVPLLERFLESEPSEARWEQLLSEHPQLRAALLELRQGMTALGRVSQAVSRSQRQRRRPGPGGMALGAVLMAGLLGVSRVPAPDQLARASMAVFDTLQAWLDIAPEGASPGEPADHRPTDASLSLESVALATRMVHQVLASPAAGIPEREQEHWRTATARLAGSLERVEPVRWEQALASAGSPGNLSVPRVYRAVATLLDALQRDIPRGDPAGISTTPEAPVDDFTRQVLEASVGSSLLSLRVYDLDGVGEEVIGAPVFAQEAPLGTGELTAETNLGSTPLDVFLPMGDWRILVKDPSTGRQSVLRVLARPDRTLAPQLCFLCTPETEDMVTLDGGPFEYGTRLRNGRPLPRRSVAVSSFLLDACETTMGEYSEFYQDLYQHPEWYEPHPLPASLPEFLDSDGTLKDPAQSEVAAGGIPWTDAVLYANWRGKRLPTSQEWEYATRGGSQELLYPWGPDRDPLAVAMTANLIPTANGGYTGSITLDNLGPVRPQPGVGKTAGISDVIFAGATPTGIYRMADNVSEWVEDTEDPRTASAGFGSPYGALVLRMLRGGSFFNPGSNDTYSLFREDSITLWNGLRCALSPVP